MGFLETLSKIVSYCDWDFVFLYITCVLCILHIAAFFKSFSGKE